MTTPQPGQYLERDAIEALPSPLWVRYALRPLALMVMAGCFSQALFELVSLLSPQWASSAWTPVGIAAAGLAYYLRALARAYILSESDRWKLYAVVLVLTFPVLRALGYVGQPWPAIWADVRAWFYNPLHFFDPETLLAFVLFVSIWQLLMATASDFERLEYPAPDAGETPPLVNLLTRYFSGGMALLILTGLARIGTAQLLNLQRPPVRGLVLNVLLYFGLGLLLLGQARLQSLLTGWRLQRLKIAPELPARWAQGSLIVLLLAASVAFILPTAYALPLLQALTWIIEVLGAVASFVMALFALFFYPLVWLLSWAAGEPDPAEPPQPQLPSVPPPMTETAGTLPPWVELARSLLLWALAAAALIYVVRAYALSHPGLWEALRSLPLFEVMWGWAQALWARLRGMGDAATRQVARVVRRLRAAAPRREGDASSAPSSPRQWLFRYYRKLLEAGAEHGHPRRAAQTPAEYRVTLADAIAPEGEAALTQLTSAFVAARYSALPPTEAELARAAEALAALERAWAEPDD